jgi:hypothetical protein
MFLKNKKKNKKKKKKNPPPPPPPPKSAIWKGSKDEKKQCNGGRLTPFKGCEQAIWQQLHDLTLTTLFSNPNHTILNLNVNWQ